MPVAGELEENKIFKDIALGTAGKGRYAGKRDMKAYRECPLWENMKKKKVAGEKSDSVNK